MTSDPAVFTFEEFSSGPVIASNNDTRFRKLAKALGLPGMTTTASLEMTANEPVKLCFSALVTDENIDELSSLRPDSLLRSGSIPHFIKTFEDLPFEFRDDG